MCESISGVETVLSTTIGPPKKEQDFDRLMFKITSLDLLLPRLLAGIKITRRDLAKMAEGGFCLSCKKCTYPKCPFGK